jgi:hypothetical protein
MKLNELEIVKNQAQTMDINIVVINYDINRYSVAIGNQSYTKFQQALSALSIAFLKKNK